MRDMRSMSERYEIAVLTLFNAREEGLLRGERIAGIREERDDLLVKLAGGCN